MSFQTNFATAKVKTIQASSTITAATNAAPIAVTTSAAHGLETGDIVQISGVVGNLGANGQFVVTKTSSTAFTLNNSNGSGAWSSGGTVAHLGFATAAVLVDNTVYASTPANLLIQARAEAISSGAKVRFHFVDSADANFVTEQPVATFMKAGAITSASYDDMFTFREYDVADLRYGASGDNMRLKVFISGGAGSAVTFSAWLR